MAGIFPIGQVVSGKSHRLQTHQGPPHFTTIASKLSRVLPAVHALVLLAALLFYRAYYTQTNNTTMSAVSLLASHDENEGTTPQR